MVYTTGMRRKTETLDILSSRLPSLKVSGSRVASGKLRRSTVLSDGGSGADKVNEVSVVESNEAGDGSDQVDRVKNQGVANPRIEGQENHVDHNDKGEASSDQGSGKEKLRSPREANQGGHSFLACCQHFIRMSESKFVPPPFFLSFELIL